MSDREDFEKWATEQGLDLTLDAHNIPGCYMHGSTNDLLAAFLAGRKPQWISTKDRMPEQGKVVIVPGGLARWSDALGWVTETGMYAGCQIQWEVRWWMPFPKAPDE